MNHEKENQTPNLQSTHEVAVCAEPVSANPESVHVYASFLSGNVSRESLPLTRERFYEEVGSRKVAELIKAIERVPEGADIRHLKGLLPAVQYMAQWPQTGIRPKKEDSLPTGLCMHDFDGLSISPAEIYEERVQPLLEQLQVALCHTTPSGKGLRLVTLLQEGETIAHCQHRVAQALGLTEKADEHVKDICRLSYLVPSEYIHYIDDKMLFEMYTSQTTSLTVAMPQSQMEEYIPYAEEVKDEDDFIYTEEVKDEDEDTEAEEDDEIEEAEIVEEPKYEEVPLKEIVKTLEERVAKLGVAREGMRNNTLYLMAKHLFPLVGGQFAPVYELLSERFRQKGLADEEIRATIGSAQGAAAKNGGTVSELMTGILSELKPLYRTAEAELELPALPKLPPFLEMLTTLFPERLKAPVVLASLSMLGTLATGIRFKYQRDAALHSLSFLVHVMAPAVSCKSYVNHLKNIVVKRLIDADRAELKEAEKERKERRGKGDNERKEYKDHKLRLVPAQTTLAALYEQIGASEGEHLLLCTDELIDIVKNSSSAYTNFKTIMIRAFDNGEISKGTVSDSTANIRCDTYLNTVTCATNQTTLSFYRNAEDGHVLRTLFITLPSTLAEDGPVYDFPDARQQSWIDEMTEKLMQEKGEVDLPVLNMAIKQFLDESKNQYILDEDMAYRTFALRSAVIGFRAGVLAWLLEGKPKCLCSKRGKLEKLSKTGKRIVDFALWVARYNRQMQYILFAKQAEEQINAVAITPRKTRVSNVYDLVPMTFTLSDMANARVKALLPPCKNLSTTIARWTAKSWIAKQADGHTWKRLYDTSEQAIAASKMAS